MFEICFMSLRRYIFYPLIVLLTALFIGTGLFVLVDTLLPGLIENRIVSILKKDVGISEVTLNLHKLYLRGADLGPLSLGSIQNPALVIRSLHVDYSPGELYRRNVKNIVVGGVELHAEFKNGKVGLRGFDLAELLNRLETKTPKDNAAGDTSFPFFPQRIEINSATLHFEINGQTHRIPFEMVAVKEAEAAPILNVLVDLYPRGQAIKISARVDLGQKRLAAQLTARQLNLLRFADLFESVAGLHVAGIAGFELNADFLLDPFSISAVHGRAEASEFIVGNQRFQFRNLLDAHQQEKPLTIDFERSDGPDWRIQWSDFALEAPLEARIADMTATLQPHADQYEVFANLRLLFEPSDAAIPGSVPIRLNKPLDLPLEFSGRYFNVDAWQFDLAGGVNEKSGRNEVDVDYDHFHIATRFPEVALTGGSREGHVSAVCKLKAPDVRISSAGVNISLPQLGFRAETAIDDDGTRGATLSTIDLEIPGGKLTSNSFRMEADRLAAVCKLRIDEAGARRADGQVTFDGGHLTDTQGRIELTQVKGDIPVSFPAATTAKKGRVEIGAVKFQTRNMGSIGVDLKQTNSGLSFDGDLKSPLISELLTKFSGELLSESLENSEVRANFEIIYPETAPEIDLGELLPAAGGFFFRGKLIQTGDLIVTKEGIRAATATMHLKDGTIEHPGSKVSIEGIQMDLSIPDLVKVRSAPGQQLKVAHASLGEMNVENAEIDFQIESTRSILVEKSRFTWCDGNVEAPAIRFASGTPDYHLILYCDRLNLAEVLRQFGAANEQAEGRLNGRIPLSYRNGRLSFTDGFLYTTPGESGKIRMMDTEMLTAGIPPDTPQYIQMELARKALEDYDYSWAKLNLTTEGEDLLLKLQLDGKPAKSLPFVYQKELGGFAEVEADVQGSTFQGIRLDVNFRLPLNKIMQYKELIQLIQ